MLTTNVDVSDGLVNGARGEVVHVVTINDNRVTIVLIKFDNSRVGMKVIQSIPYRANILMLYHKLILIRSCFPARGRKSHAYSFH